jgi:hypothetical protein
LALGVYPGDKMVKELRMRAKMGYGRVSFLGVLVEKAML